MKQSSREAERNAKNGDTCKERQKQGDCGRMCSNNGTVCSQREIENKLVFCHSLLSVCLSLALFVHGSLYLILKLLFPYHIIQNIPA